jgi:hypothetical protein
VRLAGVRIVLPQMTNAPAALGLENAHGS